MGYFFSMADKHLKGKGNLEESASGRKETQHGRFMPEEPLQRIGHNNPRKAKATPGHCLQRCVSVFPRQKCNIVCPT